MALRKRKSRKEQVTDLAIDYLKLKSFFVWIEVDLALNEPDKLVPQLASGFKDAFALVTWLRGVPENIEE